MPPPASDVVENPNLFFKKKQIYLVYLIKYFKINNNFLIHADYLRE